MTSNCINFEYAKLFMAISTLQLNDRREITRELNEFKEICNDCFNLVNTLTPPYTVMYKAHAKNIPMDLPIIFKFFSDIKEFSKEAYEFITEGYDILNLKEFLACENLNHHEASNIIWGMYRYSRYITYAIEKILDEKDKQKQLIMLRGLTGV